ncbi:MAG: hypothetical protein R3F11_29930 [Verrucomicrobiales bacterium]
MSTSVPSDPSQRSFPPFSLTRLIGTVFEPTEGKRVCVLIDLADPAGMKDFAFLEDPDLSIQRYAHDIFYQGLKNGGMAEMGMTGGEMFAFR